MGNAERPRKTYTISLSPNRGRKQIFQNKQIDHKINRLEYYQHGLPNGDKIMANGKMKYSYSDKLWICAICNFRSNKYNWLQMLGRVKSKHAEGKYDDDDFAGELKNNTTKL